MEYFVLILLSVGFAYLGTTYKFKSENSIRDLIFKLLPIIIISLVAGLRGYTVGTDTNGTYLDIYNISTNNLWAIRDKGYAILNYIVKSIFGNYTAVLIVVSFITYGLVFYRIYKISKIEWYSVLLFFATDFFFISMNMVRQSIAIAIFMFAITLLHSNEKKDIILYFVMAFIAGSMHTTGLIMIPAFFLYRFIKLSPVKAIIFTVANIILCGIVIKIALAILFKIEYFNVYFKWYFDSSYNSGELSIVGIMIPFTILILWAVLYKFNESAKDDIQFNDLGISMLIAGNLAIYSNMIPLIQRISLYFSSMIILFLPCIFLHIDNKKYRKIMEIVTAVCYLTYMIITIYIQKQEGVLPYYSVIFGG